MLSKDESLALDYPYIWTGKPVEGLMSIFEELKTYELDVQEKEYLIKNLTVAGTNRWYLSGSVVVVDEWSEFDKMSSYFNQHVRVKCKRFDEPMSPKQYWNRNKRTVVDKASKMAGGLTIENLDSVMWSSVRGCGMFRPSLMTGWLKRLNAKSVLDFSAGWQDRLIGAIAADVRYVGVDPNTDLVDSFERIVEMFASEEDKHRYTLIAEPFQTCKLPDEKFDAVLTSPPYFDLEIYSSDDTQSVQPGDTLNDWLVGFLFPSLDKAWGALRDGGNMALVINDMKTQHYVDIMIQYMKLVTASPVSLVPYMSGNAQPMWLWLGKSSDDDLEPDEGVSALQWSIEMYIRTTDASSIVYVGEDVHAVREACEAVELPLTIRNNSDTSTYDVIADAQLYVARTRGSLLLETTHPIVEHLLNKSRSIHQAIEPIPLTVLHFEDEGRNFHVIQDHVLRAGTKQRTLSAFTKLKAEGYKEIVSYGTPYGYSQVAMGYASRAIGIKCTMFMERLPTPADLTMKAIGYGLRVHYIDGGYKNEKKRAMAYEYSKSRGSAAYFVELGLDDELFIDAMASDIKTAGSAINPSVIWLAGGSGTLARALARAFPRALLNIVLVGRQISQDVLDQIPLHKIYKSKIPFQQDATVIPPYESLPHYDAKVWEFVVQYGQDGDYVWNVK